MPFGAKAQSFRCSSSPHQTHFVGLWRGPLFALLPRTRLYRTHCGENVGTLRITNLIYSRKAGGCEGISIFHGTAARRGKGISDSAAADLIASHAPLRNGSHKARQNGPKHYPRGFKGPQPLGTPFSPIFRRATKDGVPEGPTEKRMLVKTQNKKAWPPEGLPKRECR